jgi:predicted N-formylglutamate amidohydrolase
VAGEIGRGRRVVHVSSHSFTPRLHGKVRQADVGLLYDPRRAGEVRFAKRWQTALLARAPALRVRRNNPYRGENDGLTTSLRKRHATRSYLGLELEINQAIVLGPGRAWTGLRRMITETLQIVLRDLDQR